MEINIRKICKICKEKIEILKHIIRVYQATKNEIQTEELFNENRRESEAMDEIVKERKNRKGEKKKKSKDS